MDYEGPKLVVRRLETLTERHKAPEKCMTFPRNAYHIKSFSLHNLRTLSCPQQAVDACAQGRVGEIGTASMLPAIAMPVLQLL